MPLLRIKLKRLNYRHGYGILCSAEEHLQEKQNFKPSLNQDWKFYFFNISSFLRVFAISQIPRKTCIAHPPLNRQAC